MAELVLSPRFRISDHHGLQAARYRLIDDLSNSMANSIASTNATYFPHGHNAFFAVSKYRRRPDGALEMRPFVFPHA